MTQRKSARVTKRMILMRMFYRSEGFMGGANASPFFLPTYLGHWSKTEPKPTQDFTESIKKGKWEGGSRNHLAKRGSTVLLPKKIHPTKIGKW